MVMTTVVIATTFVGVGSAYSYAVNGTGVFSASNSGCLAPNIGTSVQYINDAPIPLYADIYISSVGMYGADPGNRCASPLVYDGITYQGYRVVDSMSSPVQIWFGGGYHASSTLNVTVPVGDYLSVESSNKMSCSAVCDIACVVVISTEQTSEYTVSGDFYCVDSAALYIKTNSLDYMEINYTSVSPYNFKITDGCDYMLLFSNGVYHDFACAGNEVFNYDACTYVYGYTCGVDSTRLYRYDGGWVLGESVSHSGDYNVYEFLIEDGEDYLISFADRGFVCYNETFSCTGSDVHIDFDRCQWVYPPSAGPEAIYLWAGYDYNIVIMKDSHGNFIENSQVAIYDKTDDTHIYKWTDTPDGYLLLGTKFDTDHDVQITARTFDGTFTLNTVFPANGTPIVGEEDIAITNWTIPIMYNLGLQPVDQTGKPVFDVFCGLMEYTPLNPLSFWGMDLSDRGYVLVTNCSGFAMCDIIAEKDGYTDYNVSMINWTSRSAMVKDYRHNIVMGEE